MDKTYDREEAESLIECVHTACRELGGSNVEFELFDLGYQLGILHNNTDSEKRWAVRVRLPFNSEDIESAINILREKTR